MNWGKIAMAIPGILNAAMHVAENFSGAKTGAEKEAAVLKSVPTAIAGIEDAFDVDLLNDDNVQALMKDYIAARIALMNGIEHAKSLKASPPPPPSA